MGLKFEKNDDLDKLFESFAVDPDKKVQKDEDIQKFLKPKNEQTDKKRIRLLRPSPFLLLLQLLPMLLLFLFLSQMRKG